MGTTNKSIDAMPSAWVRRKAFSMRDVHPSLRAHRVTGFVVGDDRLSFALPHLGCLSRWCEGMEGECDSGPSLF